MTFATNMQSVASRLLTKYGRVVTLTRVTEGAYNPSTSDAADGATITYSGVAHPSPYTVAEIATGTVTVGDVRLLIYTTTAPLIGDTAVVDTVTYRVMNVDRVSVQGQDIIYRLQLRI